MTNPSNIEKVVMRRVHTVRALRVLFSTGTLAVLVLGVALYGIGREVWVARVFENAPHDAVSAVRFFWYAFDHTRLTVQVFSVVSLMSVVYLARLTAERISRVFAFAS